MNQLISNVIKALCLSLCCLYSATNIAKEAQTVSPAVYKKLQKVEKLMAADAYTQAISSLKQILPEVESKAYARAVVLRALSSAYAMKGDYGKAAEQMEKCLATGGLSDEQSRQARFNLGQMYLGSERYQKAVQLLEPLFASATPAPSASDYMMLANAYSQLNKYHQALTHARKAISMTQKPPETWYQLVLALNYELQDYSACAQVLQKLVHEYSAKKDYWQQLSAIYYQLKQYKKTLATKELAYKSGILASTKDVTELVNLYLHQEAPYKAAVLMAKEMTAGRMTVSSQQWEKLANAWTMAREFDQAVVALKKAAELNNKGELYYQLGRTYVEQEDWSKAHTALLKAFQKGNLQDPGNAHILFGMSCYELHFKDKAKGAFITAQKYARTRKTAQQWLNYIEG